MPKNGILAFSMSEDAHVFKVKDSLVQRGFSLHLITTQQIGVESDIPISFGRSKGNREGVFYHNNEVLKLEQIKSVWVRKPYLDLRYHFEEDQYIQAIGKYKLAEYKILLNSWLQEAEDGGLFLVNNPFIDHFAAHKPRQLSKAKMIGLDIPDTLISASKDRIMDFLERHNNKVVSKKMSSFYPVFNKKVLSGQTWVLTQKKFQDYYSNRQLDYPIYVQEQIKKLYELRITIMGKQVFACVIYSQEKPKARIDWRMEDVNKLRHEVYQLPKFVENKCLALMKELNLQYGAIDMAVTPEGKYVFFEVNPNGQYLWLEEITGVPLSSAMADLLCDPEQYMLK